MRSISFSEAISEAQRQEMERDDRVFLMGLVQKDPYGSAFGQTKGISDALGSDRIIDTPVSENGYVGAGVGAAITGMRPVVELQFSDFVTIAMDQVCQQGANLRYMFGGQIKVPMVLRAPTGAYLSAAAQHSHCLESWFAFIPGLKVVIPSNAYDAKGLLISAIRDDNFVIYLEHKKLYDKTADVPEGPFEVPIGKAALRREGADLTIVAWSFMVSKALEAAGVLEEEGISADVVDLRTVSPIDEQAVLQSVEKTGKLLIAQETYRHCSVATDVSAMVAEKAFDCLDEPIVLITAKDVPIPFAPVMENYVLPQAEDIIGGARRLCRREG